MNSRQPTTKITIGEIAILILGLAVGFWSLGIARSGSSPIEPLSGNSGTQSEIHPYGTWIGILGGLSLVGPPMILWGRRKAQTRRRIGPGELLWFSQGMSAWLLLPPQIYRSLGTAANNRASETPTMCFAYGTPLMAIYVGSALIAGGWLRPGCKRKRRRPITWRERFGLILGVLWACTGGYCLYLIHAGR
jgi:hypothetical protein